MIYKKIIVAFFYATAPGLTATSALRPVQNVKGTITL